MQAIVKDGDGGGDDIDQVYLIDIFNVLWKVWISDFVSRNEFVEVEGGT